MNDKLTPEKADSVLTVKLFGSLVDVTGENTLKLDHVSDTDTLRIIVVDKYPGLGKFSFAIALNKQLIHGNQTVSPFDEVALLPPFSGG